MKQLITFLMILIIINLSSTFVKGQSFTKSISIGYGASLADKRIDFLNEDYNKGAARDKDLLEHDFFINFKKSVRTDEKWQIQGGLGYLVNLNTFALPISRDFFKTIWIPYLNEKYFKHAASISLDLNYLLKQKQHTRIFINQSIYGNFSFFKSATEQNGPRFVYWGLEPSEIELYGGIQIDGKRVFLNVQVRQVNLAFRDDALANNGKKIDFYNPVKLRISLGRKF